MAFLKISVEIAVFSECPLGPKRSRPKGRRRKAEAEAEASARAEGQAETEGQAAAEEGATDRASCNLKREAQGQEGALARGVRQRTFQSSEAGHYFPSE